jgi:uncharacterized protein YdbL (DUF1318 family)
MRSWSELRSSDTLWGARLTPVNDAKKFTERFRPTGRIRVMKLILIAVAISFAASHALAATCKEQAADKKLAGAALNSFMGKCQKDAKATCDTSAQDKKLAGAAKTSFSKKCVNDAVGQ